MVRRVWVAAAVVGIWLSGAVLSHAQQGTGELRGRILDAQGAVLPGVTVVAKNEASGQVREIVSGGDGSFFMSALTPGTYEITAQLSGFKTAEITGVEIRVGDSRSLGQITLAVGGQTEQVVVALQPDMVPLNSGEKSATLTSDQIENIPIVDVPVF